MTMAATTVRSGRRDRVQEKKNEQIWNYTCTCCTYTYIYFFPSHVDSVRPSLLPRKGGVRKAILQIKLSLLGLPPGESLVSKKTLAPHLFFFFFFFFKWGVGVGVRAGRHNGFYFPEIDLVQTLKKKKFLQEFCSLSPSPTVSQSIVERRHEEGGAPVAAAALLAASAAGLPAGRVLGGQAGRRQEEVQAGQDRQGLPRRGRGQERTRRGGRRRRRRLRQEIWKASVELPRNIQIILPHAPSTCCYS